VRVQRSSRGEYGVAITVCVVLVVGLIAGAVALFAGYGRTDGGHIAVVRNGGPLDNTKIRQIVPAGSGRVRIGWQSTMHDYPTSQRFYTITGDGSGDRSGVDVVQVPTADGIEVGIEGTAYFTINTGIDNDYAVLRDFDNKFGTRQFKCADGHSKAVYAGDAGFSCFLDQIIRPIINNELRIAVGNIRCADLVSSCSLVQNSGAKLDTTKIGVGNLNLAKIEQDISTGLDQDLHTTLGGEYLTGVKFNLAKVDLDKKVQDSISEAQSTFAAVSSAQAKVLAAKQEALANENKQRGYNACPACQQIDILKALPQGITVFAPGNGAGLSLAVPSK
jgi:hypothetical protein